MPFNSSSRLSAVRTASWSSTMRTFMVTRRGLSPDLADRASKLCAGHAAVDTGPDGVVASLGEVGLGVEHLDRGGAAVGEQQFSHAIRLPRFPPPAVRRPSRVLCYVHGFVSLPH